jgi:tetrahydromethanopterin S-methyltransferase subunit G
MRRWTVLLLLGSLCLSWALAPSSATAVEVAPRISDREIIEALAELKAGQARLDQRMDALDQRMDTLERHMNQRFDGINQRFDDIKWFLGVMIGTLLAINTGVLGFVLRRQGYMERSLETVRDEVAFLKKLVEQLLPHKPLL